MIEITSKLKIIFTTILFYPLFLALYGLYSVGCRLTSIAQDLFTLLYIEQICGFKRNDKITSGINAFGKVPEDLVVIYEIGQFIPEDKHCEEGIKETEQKILSEHFHILNKINSLKKITIYFDSLSPSVQRLISNLQKSLREIPSQKQIKILCQKDITQQQISPLSIPDKTYTPFLIIFSTYESICNIPAKYLVNAEIAFNSNIFNSTNYDLYKSFGQYSESKQRNGK